MAYHCRARYPKKIPIKVTIPGTDGYNHNQEEYHLKYLTGSSARLSM